MDGMSKKTHIIAVGNQKGGVGKTTNAVHLAAALGDMGRKCLIIDLDMNQGATRHLGVPSNSFLGTYEVLIGEEQPEDVIITNGDDDVELPKNVDLIAASRKLEGIEEALSQHSKFIVEQDILIKPLQDLFRASTITSFSIRPRTRTPRRSPPTRPLAGSSWRQCPPPSRSRASTMP